MRICVRVRETAVLSQQGRLRQSADRQMSVLTTNQDKSMKNTDLFPKCKCNQYFKQRQRISPLRNFKFSGAKEHNLTIWANLSE